MLVGSIVVVVVVAVGTAAAAAAVLFPVTVVGVVSLLPRRSRPQA